LAQESVKTKRTSILSNLLTEIRLKTLIGQTFRVRVSFIDD
jgi:hypothetical protein